MSGFPSTVITRLNEAGEGFFSFKQVVVFRHGCTGYCFAVFKSKQILKVHAPHSRSNMPMQAPRLTVTSINSLKFKQISLLNTEEDKKK